MAARPEHAAAEADGAIPEPQPSPAPAPESEKPQEKPSEVASPAPEASRPPEKKLEKAAAAAAAVEKPKGPSGGFDSTPIPARPAGYTVKFTFHRAENLPMADINAFSSDPYCLAQLDTDTPKRHKEDPHLRWRSSTVRKTTEPEWNEEWIVANVPASGFKLKVRVYDEDPADSDDLLGKIHVTVPSLDENWKGIANEGYKLIVHDGSKRAYLLQAVTTCFRANKHFRGSLYISVEMLGRTAEDGQSGRLYTVGPGRWFRHFSPMLGRLVNIKEPGKDDSAQRTSDGKPQKKVSQYNFQANQIQLRGPVPAKLYHRFVEFKPWVGRMFTSKGFSGVLMGKALHHQHTRVYNFGRSTVFDTFPANAGEEVTKKFLELVHYDNGGRIFTYIITLDALWRFTETGKEFGIDMLSKHTMHSDVSIYIAFSGEFFVRRLKHPRRPAPPDATRGSSPSIPQEGDDDDEQHPPDIIPDGTPEQDSPRNPNYYQLVIDNDSGTYRPNAELLPLLKAYLASQLPGLHILTLDCNADAERQQRMKKEQRERKKAEGDHIVYTQGSRSSSISSSELEELDAVQAGLLDEEAAERQHGVMSQAAKDVKLKNKARMQKMKRNYMLTGDPRPEGSKFSDEAVDVPKEKGAEPEASAPASASAPAQSMVPVDGQQQQQQQQ